MSSNKEEKYWRKNLKILLRCMLVWFFSSYGMGIIFVDQLNNIQIGAFKLGFWFAQQGSIYIFVCLIFYYAWSMNKIDKEFDLDEKDLN